MEGPGSTIYGSTPAAFSATAAAIDDHSETLDTHAAQIASVAASASAAGVPSGAVISFRTAAEITAAGAGWSRETNLDGRILIGAGTAGGQTFTEATNYGSNWIVAFTSGVESSVNGLGNNGGTNTPAVNHTHATNVTLIPPSRAYVYARKA